MAQARTPDPLAAAIAQASQPAEIAMVQAEFSLPTGRPVMMAVPQDITDFEILGLVAIALHMGDKLRAQRPKSRIHLPS
jgi:hypothetical protein